LTNLEDGKNGSPAFKIRRAQTINKDLGLEAIVEGYVNFPIHTYIEYDLTENQWDNDLDPHSCPIVANITAERGHDAKAWDDIKDF